MSAASTTRTPLRGLLGLGLALVMICGVTTQYIAWRFHYHPALGAPWLGRLYAPWAWFAWQAAYYDHARDLFNVVYVGFLAAVGGSFIGYSLLLGLLTRRARRHEGVHGTAHWASAAEVQASGLLPTPGQPGAGVYVGGWTDPKGYVRYLRHNGPEHIAAIAPTRSGKGLSLVIPTLLSWPHSVVVNDMKGELWALTAGWRREQVGPVLKFDPAAADGSVAFNPLEEVRVGTRHEVGDVQNLVTIVVDPDGKGLVDHWAKTSHALLTGVILHLLYQKRARQTVATLADVAMALSEPHRPVEQLYDEMLANRHDQAHLYDPAQMLHPVVAAAARDMLNRPVEERGSVLSSAMSYLSLYRDPLVAANTARSDFRIRDLMDHDAPVSLYLVVRPADKDRLKPLMRLVINQIVRVLVRDELTFAHGQPVAPHRHRLLLMLDEFPSYGKLEVFQEALAYIAGYGIKAYLIMQDVAQLWGAYGHDESILSNCHVRVAFAPNKIETAEWLSKMVGTTTVIKEDIATSGQRFGAVLTNVTRAFHEVSRPLLTPDECLRLSAPVKNADGSRILEPGDVLVFVAGHAPIYGTQSLYFRDSTFTDRAARPIPPTAPLAHGATSPHAAFTL